jgi:hypothetical protein
MGHDPNVWWRCVFPLPITMGMTAPDEALSLERWCHGCKQVHTRPLTEAEREWIQRLRRSHQGFVALGLALVPLAFCADRVSTRPCY